jgi:hypothetical protein
MGFYIPEDDILHSHRHENHKSYISQQGRAAYTHTRLDLVLNPRPCLGGRKQFMPSAAPTALGEVVYTRLKGIKLFSCCYQLTNDSNKSKFDSGGNQED